MDTDFAGRVTTTHLAGFMLCLFLALMLPKTKTESSGVALFRDIGDSVGEWVTFLSNYYQLLIPAFLMFLLVQYFLFKGVEKRGGRVFFVGWQWFSQIFYVVAIVLLSLISPA